MARKKNSAVSTSKKTVKEMETMVKSNPDAFDLFAKKKTDIKELRDTTQGITNRSVTSINKENLRSYFTNIGGQEKNLRAASRYLYYRSNVYFRIIQWYADMWDLRCRKVTPKYDLNKELSADKVLKQFNDTLDNLDNFNLQGNMPEVLTNVYIDDVCYALVFSDDTGTFFYVLDPDDCIIDSRYSNGGYGFAVNMGNWRSTQRQTIIESIGEPLKSMWDEYQRTNVRYIHCPDEYALCLKFRTDRWDSVIPPFVGSFLSFVGLEDLVDIQADADALDIYKLIYLPMKILSGSKDPDNYEIDPSVSKQYFDRLLAAIPENVGAAMVPGDELKYIDFSKGADTDVNNVQRSQAQILNTAGGGAVLNSSKITTNAGFKAWMVAETEFAMSTLMPQINAFTNRMLNYKMSNPCKVDHFEVSVYTKDDLAENLLKANQYSYSYRLAYGTLLGISEKETLAMMYLENEVLKLQDIMKFPLVSSFTASGEDNGYTSEVGQGAPTLSDGDLTDEGDRTRNR